MEPSMDLMEANMEQSMHFRRANTETHQKYNVNLSKRVWKDETVMDHFRQGILDSIELF